MRLVGHVARMETGRGAYRVVVVKQREEDYLEDSGVDWRIILRWIVRKWDGEAWTGLIWLRTRTGGGLL